MASEMFRVKIIDFAKGAAVAVAGAFAVGVVTVIHSAFQTPDFNVLTAPWGMIFANAFNVATIGAEAALTGYITTNFFTNTDGKLFGRIQIR